MPRLDRPIWPMFAALLPWPAAGLHAPEGDAARPDEKDPIALIRAEGMERSEAMEGLSYPAMADEKLPRKPRPGEVSTEAAAAGGE